MEANPHSNASRARTPQEADWQDVLSDIPESGKGDGNSDLRPPSSPEGTPPTNETETIAEVEVEQEYEHSYSLVPQGAPEDFLPIDRVVLPDNIDRATATLMLNQRQRTNEFGLPIAFVRSDLLPSDLSMLTADDVEAASVTLFYGEGYPTLEDGVPFWAQLPHEPREAYLLFVDFLKQAEELGIRQIDQLSITSSTELAQLNQFYREYLWSIRSRAYDMFVVVAAQKRRLARVRNTEDAHFKQVAVLLDKLQERFEDEDWIEELSAKEAIEALETLIKIQRLSLGLTGQNASSTPRDALPDGASNEALMRQVARSAGVSAQASDDFAAKLQELTADPESGMVIQEAILRLGRRDTSHLSSGAGMGDGF